MKKALITILLLIATITQAQTFKINTNVPAQFGKYPTLTNSSEIVLSGDTIRAGGLSINLMYILNSINDTNFSINKSQPELFGQRSQVTNNNSLIFGSDTAYSNSISANLIYLLNNNIATTDVSHTFTATQYFNKLFVDTLIANNIDSVHSTYWYSDSGDTIGYINAATEKVAFFKKMTIGDLQTNTTVAENFIRSNQVQTDTIYPHSPLILAGDTTIAKKLFADSVMTGKVKVGNILINGVDNSINGANIIYTNILSANGTGYFNNIIINGINKTISGVDTLRTSWIKTNSSILNFGTSKYGLGSKDFRFWGDVCGLSINSYAWGSSLMFGISGSGATPYVQSSNKILEFYLTDIKPSLTDSANNGTSINRWKNIYAKTLFADSLNKVSSLQFNGIPEPSNPTTGQIYFKQSDSHWYGYNGTIWKQLDN